MVTWHAVRLKAAPPKQHLQMPGGLIAGMRRSPPQTMLLLHCHPAAPPLPLLLLRLRLLALWALLPCCHWMSLSSCGATARAWSVGASCHQPACAQASRPHADAWPRHAGDCYNQRELSDMGFKVLGFVVSATAPALWRRCCCMKPQPAALVHSVQAPIKPLPSWMYHSICSCCCPLVCTAAASRNRKRQS